MFWNGRKVLITGHTGFKGSWLCLLLHELNAKVIGYALPPPTQPSLFECAGVKDCITNIYGNLSDYLGLYEVIKQHAPEIIIHMAAQSLVRYSYDNPLETYATNVMGTVNLLEAARIAGGAKVIINVTSDKCYDNQEWMWGYREQDSLGGYDPYSNSKACSELITASYRNSYFNLNDFAKHGVCLASARAGNVIGGGDWASDRLIPDIMCQWLQNKVVTIRNPHAIRPWQHVLEPLSGYLLLAEKAFHSPIECAQAWNFGPQDEDVKSVAEVINQLKQLWRSDAEWMHEQSDQLHEANYLKLDCSKARHQLGWQPRWSLDRALSEVVAWYQAFKSREDLFQITKYQILEYLNGKK